jgi:hypothetical protein
MWTTFSMNEARDQLGSALEKRLSDDPVDRKVDRVRFPVGLLFIRGDRAGSGQELAEQVVASYGYWNEDSSKDLDVVFPGWGKDGGAIVFGATRSAIAKLGSKRSANGGTEGKQISC